MNSSDICSGFDDQMYSALAEITLLGESIPRELKPLWDHASRCPDCLARLEEHRMWDQQLRSALTKAEKGVLSGEPQLTASGPAQRASLVLAVSLVAAVWQLRVRRRTGWIGHERRIETRAATRKGETAASVVEFDGFAVEVIPGRESVQVTVFSSEFDVEQLPIRAVDLDGQCINRQITDKRGSATLLVPPASSYELMVEFPSRPVELR